MAAAKAEPEAKASDRLVDATDPLREFSIDGDWNSKKACYKGVWRIDVADDRESLLIVEQPGSLCCGCIPNCIRKTHHMKRESGTCWGIQYSYKGKLGGKTVCIEVVSPTEIKHMTTDGLMTMTREAP